MCVCCNHESQPGSEEPLALQRNEGGSLVRQEVASGESGKLELEQGRLASIAK